MRVLANAVSTLYVQRYYTVLRSALTMGEVRCDSADYRSEARKSIGINTYEHIYYKSRCVELRSTVVIRCDESAIVKSNYIMWRLINVMAS